MGKKNLSAKRRTYNGIMKTLMRAATILTCALVLFMIGYVLVEGVPHISWKLLSTERSYLTDNIGILPDMR